MITTKQSTNFLKFSKDTLVFRELTIGVKEDEEEEDEEELLLNPKLVTRVTTEPELGDYKKEPKFYKLQDLFTDFDSLTDEEKTTNYFRVRLQVLKVDPVDLRECCVAMCHESGDTQSCKDLPANGKAACNGRPAQLIWQIQFLVKDQASQINKNFYRVLLYTGIGEQSKNFFGPEHLPCNLYKNEDELKYVTEKLNGLLRFNVWCDAVLVRQGNYFLMKDTVLCRPGRT